MWICVLCSSAPLYRSLRLPTKSNQWQISFKQVEQVVSNSSLLNSMMTMILNDDIFLDYYKSRYVIAIVLRQLISVAKVHWVDIREWSRFVAWFEGIDHAEPALTLGYLQNPN